MDASFIAAISALVGAAAPIMAKFAIDFFGAKKKADLSLLQEQFKELADDRANLRVQQQAATTDLQKQIFELRTQIISLQKANVDYIQENATLRAQVGVLTQANIDLKARIVELEAEVLRLREVKQ